ncbi:sugar ABC transporter ATP-binding protein [Neobacillus cucumis]|uniref:ABC transporter n=1 Tax=Neobacillus cucumis TaxID=1740721 RepID=A0A2N5HIR1_9BACI|nr:sugar ABC transporter ATP-binding protein [Neobacillus cucumis]PLS05405.1 ABC transporter [Neobacillus cucumis]
MEIALKMSGIKKSFNGVPVLKGIDLEIRKGEIHALLGENGAGKSTLMNILGGILQPDQGSIELFGNKVSIPNPHTSKQFGIGFIHQELNLVSDLTIYENLFLGKERTNALGFLEKKKMVQETSKVLDLLDVHLHPRKLIFELDVSMKQIVEIARSLLQDSKIIIMDEPTTSLTDKEITKLFKVMRNLKESGYSIIFISHKLKEVLSICDRYTVLRDGELASSGDIRDVTEEILAKYMIGKELSSTEQYVTREIGDILLEVKNLSAHHSFYNIQFSLRKGEILGFTGLSGDGRTELFETIFGFRTGYFGDIIVKGKKVKVKHPTSAVSNGIGFVPKNRKENGIVKDLSVLQNMTLSSLKKFTEPLIVNQKKEEQTYQVYQQQLNIKAVDIHSSIANLSGGNQQKVILAKWLVADTEVIILDNPTQGVDIGARNDIYELIVENARKGKSFIILSSDFGEIRRICDRIYVMFQGKITAELKREEASDETLMIYATGAKIKEVSKK